MYQFEINVIIISYCVSCAAMYLYDNNNNITFAKI